MTLREQVEELLPNWDRWYPSLFDAASDLGLIKARVCSPSSLLLSNRHAGIDEAAKRAHLEKWGGLPQELGTSRGEAGKKKKKRKRRRRR